MDGFYSIVQFSPNPRAKDALAVGLIVFIDGAFKWRTSSRKLKVAKQLVRTTSKNIDWVFGQIESRLNEVNNRIRKSQEELETGSQLFYSPYENPFTQSFFEYASRYSNGLLRFSEPRNLYDVDPDIFDTLYRTLVDDLIKPTESIEASKARYTPEWFKGEIEKKIILPLYEHVNTSVTVPERIRPGLYFSLKLDCIGRNGAIYAAKSFDFENVNAQTHDKHLSHYHVFASIFNQEVPSGDNHFFVIGDEPSDINSEVHQLWEDIQSIPLIEMVSLEEAEIVTERILEAGATRIFAKNF